MSAPKFVGFIESDETRWKRFLRERAHELDLLAKIVDTRSMCLAGSRAACVCDAMIVQVMMMYVSTDAFERYRKLSKEAEKEMLANHDRNWLSVVECEMLRALENAAASRDVDDRVHFFREFLGSLYERWKIADDNGRADWQH